MKRIGNGNETNKRLKIPIAGSKTIFQTVKTTSSCMVVKNPKMVIESWRQKKVPKTKANKIQKLEMSKKSIVSENSS